jgi:hypothetical protein
MERGLEKEKESKVIQSFLAEKSALGLVFSMFMRTSKK